MADLKKLLADQEILDSAMRAERSKNGMSDRYKQLRDKRNELLQAIAKEMDKNG